MLQLDTQKNLQLLNFLENRHHSCGPPAPVGCPSTNTPLDYLTLGSFFLPSAGSRAVNAGQAPHCSNSEHKPAELTRTCSTGHHDPQENTCLKQNSKCSSKKKGIQNLCFQQANVTAHLTTGRMLLIHRQARVPNSENPSDLVLMRGIYPELPTGPTVSAVKNVPRSVRNSKVKKIAGQQYKIKGPV